MKILVLLFILGTAISSFGQNTGLYGKRTIVEVNSSSNFPLINLINSYNYLKKKGTTLVPGKNLFDFGFRCSMLRAVKNNFALGIEFSNEFSNIQISDYITVQYPSGEYYLPINCENLRINSKGFMAKMEFAGKNSLLPIGLSHQVGIGFLTTRIKDRDYLYLFPEGTQNYAQEDPKDPNFFARELTNFDRNFNGFNFMYEIHVKTPVSRSVTINYGFRYTINILRASNFNNGYLLDSSIVYNSIRANRAASVITFNLGVGYAF